MASKSDLAHLPHKDLVKAATTMRNRAMKYKKNADTMSERVVGMAVSTGAGFAMGMWYGGASVEYEKLLQEKIGTGLSEKDAQKAISEEGDPRKLLGIDKDLVAGITLAVGSLTGIGGRKVAPILEYGALGALAGWAHNLGQDVAMDQAEKSSEA